MRRVDIRSFYSYPFCRDDQHGNQTASFREETEPRELWSRAHSPAPSLFTYPPKQHGFDQQQRNSGPIVQQGQDTNDGRRERYRRQQQALSTAARRGRILGSLPIEVRAHHPATPAGLWLLFQQLHQLVHEGARMPVLSGLWTGKISSCDSGGGPECQDLYSALQDRLLCRTLAPRPPSPVGRILGIGDRRRADSVLGDVGERRRLGRRPFGRRTKASTIATSRTSLCRAPTAAEQHRSSNNVHSAAAFEAAAACREIPIEQRCCWQQRGARTLAPSRVPGRIVVDRQRRRDGRPSGGIVDVGYSRIPSRPSPSAYAPDVPIPARSLPHQRFAVPDPTRGHHGPNRAKSPNRRRTQRVWGSYNNHRNSNARSPSTVLPRVAATTEGGGSPVYDRRGREFLGEGLCRNSSIGRPCLVPRQPAGRPPRVPSDRIVVVVRRRLARRRVVGTVLLGNDLFLGRVRRCRTSA